MPITTHQQQREHAHSLRNAITKKLQAKNQGKEGKEGKGPKGVSVDEQIRLFGVMQDIKQRQDQQQMGYVNYENWISICQHFWSGEVQLAARELWKILRVLNQGEIVIPTKLVFELVTSLQGEQPELALKKVLADYLKENKVTKPLSSFRELQNYLSLQEIVAIFCPKTVQVHKKHKKKVKTQNLHQRLSNQNRTKQHQRINLKYQSMAEQLQKCSFQPSISKYTPNPLQTHNKTQIKNEISDKAEEQPQQFQAVCLDPSIFQGTVTNIPGVKVHIQRHQLCDFQRKRVQRFKQCPIGTLK